MMFRNATTTTTHQIFFFLYFVVAAVVVFTAVPPATPSTRPTIFFFEQSVKYVRSHLHPHQPRCCSLFPPALPSSSSLSCTSRGELFLSVSKPIQVSSCYYQKDEDEHNQSHHMNTTNPYHYNIFKPLCYFSTAAVPYHGNTMNGTHSHISYLSIILYPLHSPLPTTTP